MSAEDERLAREAAERVLEQSGKSKEDVERQQAEEKASMLAEPNPGSNIRHVIGIVSGKGGVGKSFVAAQFAIALQRKGFSVGILDADITGPSIPRMFGVHGPAYAAETGSYPVESEDGMKIMSINLLLDDEEAPVVWRGPIIAGAVKQFWTDVIWGDLDYLIVDMPPGTGDVPLTVFQSLPVDGIIIVTSPQELVSMIVKKAYNMASLMNIKVLGVVENYSYMICPNCKERHPVFGESRIDETAAELSLPVLLKLPLNPDASKYCDNGEVEKLSTDEFEKTIEDKLLID